MVGTALRAFAHPTASSKPLPRKPFRKRLGIDEATGVAAVADPALALEGFDREADHAALYGYDLPRDPHGRADQRRAEMADIDLGPDRDPAGLKVRPDGVAGRHLHFQDHHRRRIDHRHAGHEMPDRALGRHDQRPFSAHADPDEVACVHGLLPLPLSPCGRGWINRANRAIETGEGYISTRTSLASVCADRTP